MSWELRLAALFDDLEQQAEGLALAARDADVVELARQEYSDVDLLSRLHGATGETVRVQTSAGAVQGRMVRAGRDWFLLAHPGRWPAETLVRVASVLGIVGMGGRAAPEPVRPVTARLGAGSLLRRLAEEGDEVALADVGGQRRRGLVHRVGADFLELRVGDEVVVVPLSAVALVERG